MSYGVFSLLRWHFFGRHQTPANPYLTGLERPQTVARRSLVVDHPVARTSPAPGGGFQRSYGTEPRPQAATPAPEPTARGILPNHGGGGQVTLPSGPDTAYIWRVAGEDLFKVGITTEKRGAARIREVAVKAKVNADVLEMCRVRDARSVERNLLALGSPVDVGGVDGKTEFRRMSEEEAQRAVAMIRGAAL